MTFGCNQTNWTQCKVYKRSRISAVAQTHTANAWILHCPLLNILDMICFDWQKRARDKHAWARNQFWARKFEQSALIPNVFAIVVLLICLSFGFLCRYNHYSVGFGNSFASDQLFLWNTCMCASLWVHPSCHVYLVNGCVCVFFALFRGHFLLCNNICSTIFFRSASHSCSHRRRCRRHRCRSFRVQNPSKRETLRQYQRWVRIKKTRRTIPRSTGKRARERKKSSEKCLQNHIEYNEWELFLIVLWRQKSFRLRFCFCETWNFLSFVLSTHTHTQIPTHLDKSTNRFFLLPATHWNSCVVCERARHVHATAGRKRAQKVGSNKRLIWSEHKLGKYFFKIS